MNALFKSGSPVFLDGAMGTQLQARGLKPGETPELWNLFRPRDILSVHDAYFASGSNIVYANTFGANRAKYHGSAPLEEVVASGVALAKESARKAGANRFAALDVGPTGRLLKPAGDFEFDHAYDAFAEQISIGAKAGADLIAIETMGDICELKAAVLAAKENSSLPIIATVALGDDGKLLTGADVDCVAALLEGLRVAALGFNCGFGPDKMLPFVRRLASLVETPIVVKPNAGMPRLQDGRTVFDVPPEEFAKGVAALVEAGATIIGGCCGTTPDHIAALRPLAGSPLAKPSRRFSTRGMVSSFAKAVAIPLDDTIIIGERINPTGKKRLKKALEEGDQAYILREAVSQAAAGAHVLDVNVGVPGLDERAVLDATIAAVQSVTDLPLQIDTSDPAALELALRHYSGKALVNSVNGKEESLNAVLPLVAKYGGVVVALTLDESGIPPTSDGRLAIARKILSKGAEYGLTPDDFVIDVLCLATSADPNSANVILESLSRVRSELVCRTCLGVSNISFGLPARALLNSVFYSMALDRGLSAAIINPLSCDMMVSFRAYRALTGRDKACTDWIEAEKDYVAPDPAATSVKGKTAGASASVAGGDLATAVRHGLKADAAQFARIALDNGAKPLEIIDSSIVPALESVGSAFETGKLFLPQLLMAAEAAGAAFEVVRSAMGAAGSSSQKGPIVIATVKGDIHDIGKNICRALLENYGFKVIDLGRDVAPETVLSAARKEKAKLVGLSALMTTTVGAMAETVKLVHKELPSCPVAVGGAVLTADFAKKIEADYYSKDAMGLVRQALAICEGS